MKYFFAFFIALCTSIYAKPIISVSIPPQAYFLKQIAGDTLKIHTVIPQGIDPHTFEFSPQALLALQKSEMYLTIGLEFEEIWLPKLKSNLPHLAILSVAPSSQGFHSCKDHPDDQHHHHDPHTWLSPNLVKLIAQNIADLLISYYPTHKTLYQANLSAFLKKIDSLHQDIQNKLQSLKNRTFITYHPAWGYFAKDYQLTELSMELEGKEPTPNHLKQILETITQHQIRTIFVQKGFSQTAASILTQNSQAILWETNPLAYEWEKELLHFTQGLLQ